MAGGIAGEGAGSVARVADAGTGDGDFAAFVMRARALGATDAAVLNAIERADRARYLAGEDRPNALSDHALPLPCGQATERLDDLALLLCAADIAPHHRVLEIGTGSGFATAVLATLAARVVTVERYRGLLRRARERHARAGLTGIEYVHADGREVPGGAGDAPFDRIVATVAFPEPPKRFIGRMASDGVAVVPLTAAEETGEGPATIARLARVGVRFERREVGTGWFAPIERGVARTL